MFRLDLVNGDLWFVQTIYQMVRLADGACWVWADGVRRLEVTDACFEALTRPFLDNKDTWRNP